MSTLMRILALTVLVAAAGAQSQLRPIMRIALPADDADSAHATLIDVDGDGDGDLFSSGSTRAPFCRVYHNDGRGRFSPDMTFVSAGLMAPHVVGDADGDGDPDILLRGSLLENRGAAGLLRQTTSMTQPPIAFGDLDGDMRGDVVCLGTGGITLWRTVTATSYVQLVTPPQNYTTNGATLADLDNDGDLDLLLATSTTGPIPWLPLTLGHEQAWRNDGLGNFTDLSATWLPGVTDDRTFDMVVADLDGDGDVDCGFLSSSMTSPLAWQFRRNNGTGLLVPWTIVGMPALPLQAHDLDHDGDADLVRSDRWFANDGAGNFSPHDIDGPGNELRCIGDVDGDADLDLVLGGLGPSGFGHRLLLDQGGQQFVDATAFSWRPAILPLGNWANASAFLEAVEGDADGDGDLDLLQHGGPLMRNDGGGWFEPTQFPWASIPQFTFWTHFVDLDGDTDLDVLYAAAPSPSAGPLQLRVCVNNGTGTFTDLAPTVPPTPLPGYGAATVMDADGDGDPDFVWATYYSGFYLYENVGLGRFVLQPTALPNLFVGFEAVAPGDFDGDGDVDLLATNGNLAGSPFINMLVNDGTGVFTETPTLVVTTPWLTGQSVHVFDADGDADADVVLGVTNSASQPHALLRNNGTGQLVQDFAALPLATTSSHATAGDIDGDADVDLIITTSGGFRYWRNNGLGVFSDQGAMPLPIYFWQMRQSRLADFDGDGDADLLFGDRLWMNRQWHIEAPHLPQLGRSYSIEFGGLHLPTAVALPFFGAPAQIPLAQLGTLGVDPASAFLLPPVSVLLGSGTLTTTIPLLPNLLGLQFSLQSLLVAANGMHLTPVKRETIRN